MNEERNQFFIESRHDVKNELQIYSMLKNLFMSKLEITFVNMENKKVAEIFNTTVLQNPKGKDTLDKLRKKIIEEKNKTIDKDNL